MKRAILSGLLALVLMTASLASGGILFWACYPAAGDGTSTWSHCNVPDNPICGYIIKSGHYACRGQLNWYCGGYSSGTTETFKGTCQGDGSCGDPYNYSSTTDPNECAP